MRWSATRTGGLLTCLVALGTTGCQSAGLRFLSLIGLQEEPLVVALVADRQPAAGTKPLQALNPFAPYGELQAALARRLGRPIGLDLCFPVQLEPCLGSGMFHLAVVAPTQYARFPQPERFPVIAVPADRQGRLARPSVLVVAANSPINCTEDLRGKVVAFGRAEDARTHLAALDLLAQHGLKKSDLSLELLPLPGMLKHMPNTRAVAQTVINASSDAGFIDLGEWEELPEHTEQPDEPARDKLRVIAETVAVPDRLIVASPKLDDATLQTIRAFLLAADREHPEALRPLRVSSYQAPSEELLTACRRLAGTKTTAKSPKQ